MKKPERIALAGDWHGRLLFAADAIEYAVSQGADCILHTGDYGWLYTSHFVKRMEEMLTHAGIWLAFADGNHEHHDVLDQLFRFDDVIPGVPEMPTGQSWHRPRAGRVSDHVWHLQRGMRWTWDGVRFLACGGAHSVDRRRRKAGRSWWPQETITDANIETCAAGGPADVLLSHDCPSGVDIPGLDKTAHLFPPEELVLSDRHRERLGLICASTQPRMIVHGHYHNAYTRDAELGYGPVRVYGLSDDSNGSLRGNVLVLSLPEIQAITQVTTQV
jgi:hypothetical protein